MRVALWDGWVIDDFREQSYLWHDSCEGTDYALTKEGKCYNCGKRITNEILDTFRLLTLGQPPLLITPVKEKAIFVMAFEECYVYDKPLRMEED
jgi:hypothetical protein